MVLTGLLERLGLADRAVAVLRALDKLAKIGPGARGRRDAAPRPARRRTRPPRSSAWPQSPAATTRSCGSSSRWWPAARPARAAWPSLRELLDGVAAAGVPEDRVRLDVSIARGLDYYTGTVFETFLDALPGIGSVCSGGRYDNLAGLFTDQELPGVGASLGLDRLLAAMEELGMIEKVSTPAPVFIPYFDKDRLHDYLRLAAAIRAAGHRRRGVSRAQEARPATEVRRPPRLPRRPDRRQQRVPGRHLPGQGPCPRHAAGRAAGARRAQRASRQWECRENDE